MPCFRAFLLRYGPPGPPLLPLAFWLPGGTPTRLPTAFLFPFGAPLGLGVFPFVPFGTFPLEESKTFPFNWSCQRSIDFHLRPLPSGIDRAAAMSFSFIAPPLSSHICFVLFRSGLRSLAMLNNHHPHECKWCDLEKQRRKLQTIWRSEALSWFCSVIILRPKAVNRLRPILPH